MATRAVTGRALKVRRLLREPLLHFLLIGVAMFVGYAYFEDDVDGAAAPGEIRLSMEDLLQLETVFVAKWNRAPTSQEFRALLEGRVREEVLYREALAQGLDENDTIVRRRMAQKMQFLAEDMGAAREPTSDELRAWYRGHSETFALPARASFRHLYFAADRRGERAESDAEAALPRLAGEGLDSARAASLADPFMFQDYYGDRTPQELAREFGPDFAGALVQLKPGSWQGPVKSGYGWHLVFVDSLVPGRIPAFAEVESDVKTAWLGQQKVIAVEKAYRDMRAKYTLVLPGVPEDARAQGGEPATAGAAELALEAK